MTIHIRLAGVDAPEVSQLFACVIPGLIPVYFFTSVQLAHFGNPAQPFSKEAFDYLTNLVNQKKVTVDLLSKDRYNRIVCQLFLL